jgi:hypothetical protein
MKGPGPRSQFQQVHEKIPPPETDQEVGSGVRFDEEWGRYYNQIGIGNSGLRSRDKQNKARSITLSLGDR